MSFWERRFVESANGECVGAPIPVPNDPFLYWFSIHEEEFIRHLRTDKITETGPYAKTMWAQIPKSDEIKINREHRETYKAYKAESELWDKMFNAQKNSRKGNLTAIDMNY